MERTGQRVRPYKEYEPEYLYEMCVRFIDEKDTVDQISRILSDLILIQALPNANHRTAFFLMNIYCHKHGMRLKIYDEDRPNYDSYISSSKRIIDTEINHVNFFNKKYFDSQHRTGIQKHYELTKELIEKILVRPQSGICEVESFHSFIACLNQSGSFPFSNP